MTDDERREEYEERQEKRDVDLVKSHVAQLAEHFDTVMVFCTRHEPTDLDGTVAVQWAEGSWYARYGQIREWLIKEEERSRMNVRKAAE